MRIITFLFLLCCISFNVNAQCSWDEEICISGCNDVFTGEGELEALCFDPREATPENPLQINYCFASQKELFYDWTNPFNQQISVIKRQSHYMVCVPEDICEVELTISSVGINNGTVTGSSVIYTSTPNPEDNRPTLCMDCPSGKKIELRTHRNILGTIGTYEMCLDYKCCDGSGDIDDDNVIGGNSICFYYEFINAASNVDVEIAFLASQQIENINGDTDIDGIINTDGSFPGPELGPSSAGVRVSAVGNGVIDYNVEVFEVDCSDPQSGGSSISSETIPYNGDDEIFYSFLNIDDWENTYDSDACYKVVTTVNSICGSYTEEAFFGITDQCTFCSIYVEEEIGMMDEGLKPAVFLSNNNLVVDSKTSLNTVLVLDEYGVVLERYTNIEASKNSLEFNTTNSYSNYLLVVTISNDGKVTKTMLPNMR